MKKQHFVLLMVLVLCMITSCATTGNPSKKVSEETVLKQLNVYAADVAQNTLISFDQYEEKDLVSKAATFPSRFDLRDLGYVPEIKNQGNWGSCWGFASIGASEISILSKMKLNTKAFAEKYGKDMDLSEKHLAWFVSTHLPMDDNNINNQFGEGLYLRKEEEDGQAAHYNNGGFMGYASTYFSAAIGPVWEDMAPYAAADGSQSTAADWTLPESERFRVSFEMENSSVLPSPANRDEEGNYVYNPLGTEAIKEELLAGRAVTIGYHADVSMNPEARRRLVLDAYEARGVPAEVTEVYLDYTNEDPEMAKKPSQAPDEFREACYIIQQVVYNGLSADEAKAKYQSEKDSILENWKHAEEEAAKAAEAAAEEAAKHPEVAAEAAAKAEAEARSAAEALGLDYDKFVEKQEKEQESRKQVYINTDTYAQYTNNVYASTSHAVCIVGWDDDYAVSNFNPDHLPPAKGAWIVRNSWGKDYGNDGYFYLSYYDQTIVIPETFEFDVSDKNKDLKHVNICAYDMMPAEKVKAVQTTDPVYTANIFDADTRDDYVLSAVSVMTAVMDSKVTVAVYLLNDEAKSPVDGVMLDTVTTDFEFAGYHKINLHQNYLIPAGRKISVVQLQRTESAGLSTYAVPFTLGTSKLYMETMNKLISDEDDKEKNWRVAVVNNGESFISLDCGWKDWADVLKDAYRNGGYMDFVTIDNIGIKAYLYNAEEVKEAHHFGAPVRYCGTRIIICQDCGYTVVMER